MMIIPPFLETGDTVALVAPAKKIERDDVVQATEILKSWGLNVVWGRHLLSGSHSYFSGKDEGRCEDLQASLNDQNIAAIICARGGYGTTRLIDHLNFDGFLAHPKWIVGFSDITALHLKVQSLQIQSIHGVMPVLFSKANAEESVAHLRTVLFSGDCRLEASYNANNITGAARGYLTGGNLSLIVDSLGTNEEIDTAGKILMIEEVDEDIYKVDRMMMQLKRARKLERLAGLVIGHMTNITDTEHGFGHSLEELMAGKVAEYGYPLAFDFPFGHDFPNLSWRYGSEMKLDVASTKSSLSLVT